MLEKVTREERSDCVNRWGLQCPQGWATAPCNYLLKPWESLVDPELKSHNGQSVHKVLQEWILDTGEENSAEKDVTKHKGW